MLSNVNIQSFLERSRALQEIQRDCAVAEKGGKVDLKHTAGKLQFLVKAMNDDTVAINQGAKVSPEVDQAYLKHRYELDVTSARVKQAEQKSGNNNIFPSITSSHWEKPIAYTALAVAAVGTACLAYSYWSSGSGTGHSGGGTSNRNNGENRLGHSSSAIGGVKGGSYNSSPQVYKNYVRDFKQNVKYSGFNLNWWSLLIPRYLFSLGNKQQQEDLPGSRVVLDRVSGSTTSLLQISGAEGGGQLNPGQGIMVKPESALYSVLGFYDGLKQVCENCGVLWNGQSVSGYTNNSINSISTTNLTSGSGLYGSGNDERTIASEYLDQRRFLQSIGPFGVSNYYTKDGSLSEKNCAIFVNQNRGLGGFYDLATRMMTNTSGDVDNSPRLLELVRQYEPEIKAESKSASNNISAQVCENCVRDFKQNVEYSGFNLNWWSLLIPRYLFSPGNKQQQEDLPGSRLALDQAAGSTTSSLQISGAEGGGQLNPEQGIMVKPESIFNSILTTNLKSGSGFYNGLKQVCENDVRDEIDCVSASYEGSPQVCKMCVSDKSCPRLHSSSDNSPFFQKQKRSYFFNRSGTIASTAKSVYKLPPGGLNWAQLVQFNIPSVLGTIASTAKSMYELPPGGLSWAQLSGRPIGLGTSPSTDTTVYESPPDWRIFVNLMDRSRPKIQSRKIKS